MLNDKFFSIIYSVCCTIAGFRRSCLSVEPCELSPGTISRTKVSTDCPDYTSPVLKKNNLQITPKKRSLLIDAHKDKDSASIWDNPSKFSLRGRPEFHLWRKHPNLYLPTNQDNFTPKRFYYLGFISELQRFFWHIVNTLILNICVLL